MISLALPLFVIVAVISGASNAMRRFVFREEDSDARVPCAIVGCGDHDRQRCREGDADYFTSSPSIHKPL